ncbi:DUF2628 domain-containing protein [Rhodopseudomonas palustris]|uniref:DUF2628 domain-containing protein n=1 Tax=Rhodopseudomonas palustris TaxID=1076 RepID=A0A418VIF1_RHOPL|nr:DUF2628 domain-containing protein [Rhodopseudomonas palustris]RJF75858.1 DUF2628 domain-containing protein [Rhodopseudomonas palustris]
MPVYTVHAPPDGDERSAAPDRFVFVRDGFYFWAFVFGPLWLLTKRLWLALLGYLVVSVAAAMALSALGVVGLPRVLVLLLIAVLLGLEAGSLWRWTLRRRGWRQLDVAIGDDLPAAERRFFDRWSGRQGTPVSFSLPVDRGAPPPPRGIPLPASSIHGDIVGSFPRPGGLR